MVQKTPPATAPDTTVGSDRNSPASETQNEIRSVAVDAKGQISGAPATAPSPNNSTGVPKVQEGQQQFYSTNLWLVWLFATIVGILSVAACFAVLFHCTSDDTTDRRSTDDAPVSRLLREDAARRADSCSTVSTQTTEQWHLPVEDVHFFKRTKGGGGPTTDGTPTEEDSGGSTE